jgi:hypothetical protein
MLIKWLNIIVLVALVVGLGLASDPYSREAYAQACVNGVCPQ